MQTRRRRTANAEPKGGKRPAPAILDFTSYVASVLGKAYGLLKNPPGKLIVPLAQTDILCDAETGKYLCDLLNLKDTATGAVYRIQVTNGVLRLEAMGIKAGAANGSFPSGPSPPRDPDASRQAGEAFVTFDSANTLSTV